MIVHIVAIGGFLLYLTSIVVHEFRSLNRSQP
jgi:hypothetical protein